MQFILTNFALFLAAVTVVQAIPPPITEVLESSVKAVTNGIDSLSISTALQVPGRPVKAPKDFTFNSQGGVKLNFDDAINPPGAPIKSTSTGPTADDITPRELNLDFERQRQMGAFQL